MKQERARLPAARNTGLPRDRRPTTVIGISVLIALAVAAGGLYWKLRSGPQPRWNVVLITFDTTRPDHLSCYGYKHVSTPAIDRIARHGILYSHCYSPVPLTLPAHASIMTGLYPFYHGLRVNDDGRLDDTAPTLAEALRQEGYQTAAVVGAYVLHSRFGLKQGFDFYDEDFSTGSAHSPFFYVERNAESVTDAALDWLDGVDASPFFLWAHYFDPHAPYAPPDFNPATATTTPYDSEILYADAQMGRLLDRLEEMEQAAGRGTLIVFTADHGEALWSHGEPTHGLFTYNDTIRVPLLVCPPSTAARGAVVNTPVSLVDIYPSVLHWLGISPEHETHGRVLPAPGEAERDAPGTPRALYFETYMPYRAYGWSPLEGVVVGNQKYIRAPKPELYDLAADPLEANNRFATNVAQVAQLRRQLGALKASPLDLPPLAAGHLERDAESVRRLEALGYVGGTLADHPHTVPLADPKDMMELHRRIDRAQTEIDAGNFRDALELVQGVMEADPTNARALQLGLHLLTKAEVRTDVGHLLRERAADPLRPPFDVLVPLHLGVAALRDQRLAGAENHLRVALAADMNDASANYYLGCTLAARKQAAAAVRPYLQRAHLSDPDNRTYALAYAECLERLEEYERAAELYEGLLERDADDAVALNNSAWVHHQMRRQREVALRRAERAVALEPESSRFRHTLGCVLLWAERAEDAAAQLRRAIAGSPDYAIAYYHLGLAEEDLGDHEAANRALRKAIKLAEQPAPAWLADARDRLTQLSHP
ncbi:MAG: sulfatase-like hydrolase/transferase [Phycisphaerae bacterium]